MKIRVLTGCILTLCSSSLFAQDYQGEAGAGYYEVGDNDGFTVFGEWNFRTVETQGRPLAEAGFLGLNSNVNASYTDFDGGDITQAGLEIYLEDMFYIAPNYSDTDPDFGDDDNFSVALGLTPIDGLRVSTTIPEDDYDANIAAKYVTQIGNANFINLEAEFADMPGEDLIMVGGDYYFDNTFSLGGAVIEQFDTAWQVRANKFFTERVRAGFSYTDYDGDDLLTLDGSVRF